MGFSLVLFSLVALAADTSTIGEGDLHASFDSVLAKYVTESGVRYDAWANSPPDLQLLTDYVDGLEAAAPSAMEEAPALAYWINLYNAVTLELVLSEYPVASIKDIGGFLRSPWKKKLVTVEGKKLSLNAIENAIIRTQFDDARIHFALNCASVGCPPLARESYRGATLDEQLEHACRRALNDSRWVEVDGDRLVLTKIFDWYEDDFKDENGSILPFVFRYREDGQALAERSEKLDVSNGDYDWNLNLSQ